MSNNPFINNSIGGGFVINANIPNVTFSPDSYYVSDSIYNRGGSTVIDLSGPEADIKINGKSLKTTLEQLEELLPILHPSPQLEAQWDELKEIRDKYNETLKKCQENNEVWKILNQKS